MKEFIFENRYILIAIIGTVIYAIAEWNNVKAQAYSTMLKAKDLAKDQVLNNGAEQKKWAVDKLEYILPARVKLFVSRDLLELIVENLYNATMDLLDDGKLNNSTK